MRAPAPIAAILAALTALSAFAQEAVLELGPETPGEAGRLVIHGSTDIAPFTSILEAFAATRPDLAVRYEQLSTNDIYALAADACDAGAASADLLISSSIDQQIKLANDGCAQSLGSDLTNAAPRWANWRNEVFGLTVEPAVIVYNRAHVAPEEAPRSRFDLIDLLRRRDSRYAGRVATYDIERSGLGYLFAFADYQQAATFGRLIEALGRNNAVTTCCSAEIIDKVASGEFLIAYNMLGSYALARAASDPRIGIVAPADYTLLLSRAALIPKAAANADQASAFVEFALSDRGRGLLADASLIVGLGENGDQAPRIAHAAGANFRPIPFTPSLLVGLDRHKKARFLKQWRAAIRGGGDGR